MEVVECWWEQREIMELGNIFVEISWSGEVSMLRDHGVGKYRC